VFYTADGQLLTKAEQTLVAVPGGVEKVEVVSDAAAIGAYAFGSKVTDVTIPATVTAIDAKAFGLCALDQLVIRGEAGSAVVLSVLRGDTALTLTAVRANYSPQTVYAEAVMQDGQLFGYVRIVEFLSVQTTYNQFKNAVDGLIAQNVQGFIFDVRDNSGGDLNAILYILDYLLPEGPLVHMYYAGREKPVTYSSDASEIDLPMVVLANENTASAAELFTSALRDYEKAEVIGKKTFGKGCGQSGTMFSDGSVAFITTFLYNPPYSEGYDGIGIYPDHEVTLAEEWTNKNLFLVPHEEDAQLMKAVEVITSKASDAQS
jgi:carboxyl-terminal processing protease